MNSENSTVLNTNDQEDLLILNIKFIVYVGLVLPLATVGLILNSFTIAVLLHPRMRNSTNAYLTALSLANIFCLLFFIIMYSLRFMLSFDIFKNVIHFKVMNMNGYENFINMIYPFGSPVFSTFQLFAIYLTCAVTVDRWIYLKWPLKADSICTITSTIRVIFFIFLFCVAYNFPRWFEVETIVNNSSFYQAKLTSLSMNYYYNIIYQRYCYIIFVYGIPFLVLLIVNAGIIKGLIETKRRKNTLLGNSTRKGKILDENTKETATLVSSKRRKASVSFSIDPKITLMVLAVVLAFFCCQFPYLCLYLLRDPKAKVESFNFKLAKTICDLLAALNCCINFLIYCLFGQNFRQIAKAMMFNPSLKPYSRATIHRHNNYNNSTNGSKIKKKQPPDCKNQSIKLEKMNSVETKS